MKKVLVLTMALLMMVILLLTYVSTVSAQDAPLSTALAVQNLGNEATDIVVVWYDEEGGPAASSQALGIAPGGLGNFMVAGDLPVGWVGSVVVYSQQPVAVIANTANDFGAPSYWGSSEGFADDKVSTAMYLPFVLRNRSNRSSIVGVQNAGAEQAEVTIDFVGHSSSPVDDQLVLSLAPGASTIVDFADEMPSLGNGWMGSLAATSTQPLAAIAFDVGPALFYDYSGVGSPATDLVLPFVVGGRSGQDTAHALLNPNSVEATVWITYTGEIGGSPVQEVISATVAAHEMWNQLHSVHTGAGFLGSAVVHSDEPVLGIVNHTYGAFATSGRKMSYHMVPSSSLTPKISLPYVLRERSNKRQGIIIQNASDMDTTMYVSFKPAAGGGNGNPQTHAVFVEAGGFYNFGTNYAEWDPILNGAFGTMVVTNTAAVDIVGIVNTWNIAVSTNVDSLGSYVGTNY